METLESSRVCRLCGKQSGISINIFDKNENHVKKISAVLPIMVHEMDLLPKHMCHRCSYKLEEFHKFYIDCLKTDADLKSQLSWMRKEDSKERVGVPMVHIENIKIKVEPPDYDAYEMDSMVDNVGYIKSMSSVTFPVNGVRSKDISKGMAYATYAHCDCYCDKADQSNSSVPTNFDSRISRCNRLEDVKSEEVHEDNHSRTVPSPFLPAEPFGERSTMEKIGGEAEHSRNCEPTSSVLSLANSKLINVPRTPVVRNLRPRKRSVDYVGIKRRLKVTPIPPFNAIIGTKEARSKASSATMLAAATQIKVEKLDDGLTRVLRPRKGTIDYIGPKRKYSRSRSKVVQRSQGEDRRSNKTTVRNIARQLKLSTKRMSKLAENRIQVTIKEEQISDLEDNQLVESSKNQVMTSIDDLMANQIDKLPTNGSGSLRNNRVNRSTFNDAQPSSNFSIASTWKLLRSSPKSKSKSREFGMSRVSAMNHSPRYLRSQDVYLRSGRIRKLDAVNASARKLQRSLRNLTKRGETTAKNLMKVIRDTVTVKTIPGAMKLIDNIKHYCEECNTSFANKELFKLHACYGH